MIHRFLIYDRKFNCRLDRRYPLNQFTAFNRESLNLPSITGSKVPILTVSGSQETTTIHPVQDNWNTLVIKSESDDESDACEFPNSLSSQMSRMEINENHPSYQPKGEIVEHSQQLILGMTHSLKNMFLKLSPSVNAVSTAANSGIEGYSFSVKTSKYRLFYFESFTGWKLVMITDCGGNTVTIPSLGQVTPESALKLFYTNILLKFLLTYPLGTILTERKSSQREKVRVENDLLHRAGFLIKMDEFIHSIDSIF